MNVQAQESLALDRPISVNGIRVVDWLDVLPPKANCLYDYQRRQIAELARALRTYMWILMQAPTGAGKTHMIAAIVMAAVSSGLRVLVLATRTRLVWQMHERLLAFEIRHGVIAARLPELRNNGAPVQVASVDTLYQRAIVSGKMPMPAADVVIFDEAHLATAVTRMRVLGSYPSATRIGFTATPARKSGRSLAAAFDCIVLGPSVIELTAAGVLVPTRIFNTPLVTQEELRSLPEDADNDFQPKALADLLIRPKLIGNVVENWLRLAAGKRTLCFAVDKAHAAALLESFRRQGVPAEMLTGVDDEPAREKAITRLESGDTLVLINCFLMSYGVDVPTVECIVLARPTRSLVMYLQMVGRGLRAAPGKTRCILIDHGHVVENLGLPQSEYEWTLDPDRNVNAEAVNAKGRKTKNEAIRTCGECGALWLTSAQGTCCPECGWTPPQQIRAILVEDADLQELADVKETPTPNDVLVMAFYRQSCGWYARRWPDRWLEKSNGGRWWAWLQTRDRFQLAADARMPSSYWSGAAEVPSIETIGWLKYQMIRRARAKTKVVA